MKKFFLIFIIVLISFIIADRILYFLKPSVYRYSDKLGWEIKKNYEIKLNQADYYSQKYQVDYSTDEFGARTLGNKINSDYSILVIGDSFTMDPYTSNSLSWFGIFKDKIERKINKKTIIYAIGGGGYGTNQQYLKTIKFLKDSNLNPDMVLLQFCVNDFMNNSYDWEVKSENYNQYLRRPYLNNNNHFFFHTTFLSKIVRSEIFSYFTSPNYIFMIAGILKQRYFSEEIDFQIKKESIKTTLILIKKLGKLFNTKNFYIFNCKEGSTYPENNWYEVLQETNEIILKNPSLKMKEISKTKPIFFKDGGHYNELGNQYLGNFVFLEVEKYLK